MTIFVFLFLFFLKKIKIAANDNWRKDTSQPNLFTENPIPIGYTQESGSFRTDIVMNLK